MPIMTSRYDASPWIPVMTTRHDRRQLEFAQDGVNSTIKFQKRSFFKKSYINCTRYRQSPRRGAHDRGDRFSPTDGSLNVQSHPVNCICCKSTYDWMVTPKEFEHIYSTRHPYLVENLPNGVRRSSLAGD